MTIEKLRTAQDMAGLILMYDEEINTLQKVLETEGEILLAICNENDTKQEWRKFILRSHTKYPMSLKSFVRAYSQKLKEERAKLQTEFDQL